MNDPHRTRIIVDARRRFTFYSTCVASQSRQSRAQCRARELCCKFHFQHGAGAVRVVGPGLGQALRLRPTDWRQDRLHREGQAAAKVQARRLWGCQSAGEIAGGRARLLLKTQNSSATSGSLIRIGSRKRPAVTPPASLRRRRGPQQPHTDQGTVWHHTANRGRALHARAWPAAADVPREVDPKPPPSQPGPSHEPTPSRVLCREALAEARDQAFRAKVEESHRNMRAADTNPGLSAAARAPPKPQRKTKALKSLGGDRSRFTANMIYRP